MRQAEGDHTRALRDREQAIGIVESIDDLRLPRHGHRRPTRGIVVGIGDAPLGCGLTGQEVQAVKKVFIETCP